MFKKILLIIPVLIALAILEGYSQRLVYKPTNPAFGGDTFNYQWMLSSAQAQDTTKDPSQRNSDDLGYIRDPLTEFSESLNRQILNTLARELVLRQFGEDQIGEGSYSLGDYQIDITNSGSGLNITILDNVSGASTQIEVPFF